MASTLLMCSPALQGYKGNCVDFVTPATPPFPSMTRGGSQIPFVPLAGVDISSDFAESSALVPGA